MSKFRLHKGVVKSVASILCAIEDRIVQRMSYGMTIEQKQENLESLKAKAHDIVAAKVQVNLADPMHLHGYKGDMRAETANIRIPKEVVNQYLGGGASNDVGFTKTETGEFDAIVSEYDKGAWWNRASDRFWQAAATFEAAEAASFAGYTVETNDNAETGMIELTCTSYT